MNNVTREEFTNIVSRTLDECQTVLGLKGEAYAGSGDVTANFKRVAANLGLTPYQVWAVYAGKHVDTIFSAIKLSPDAPVDKSEGLDGRIVDAINYLLLLKALLVSVDQVDARVFTTLGAVINKPKPGFPEDVPF